MTIFTMPTKSASGKWPCHYGFDVVGEGPCYVVGVQRGQLAYNAGLMLGDEILELDGQDVGNLCADDLVTLARNSRSQPPTLGVVSRLQSIELVCSRTSGFGFDVSGSKLVKVSFVEQASTAAAAGLRQGDIILEVNGKAISTEQDIKDILQGKMRRMTLSIIPAGKTNKSESNIPHRKLLVGGSRIKKARNLHNKMNEILGDDYEKKMAVVGVLKQYAEDRDVDMLARALAVVLKTPPQQKVVRQIRQFIPPKARARFDEVIRQQQSLSRNSQKAEQHSKTPGKPRAVHVIRDEGSFGFVIKGNNPVFIETVDKGGPADKAGLEPGDFVVKLNGIDVKRCSHSHLVQLLQDSGSDPLIEVVRPTEDGEYPVDVLHGSSSVVSMMSAASSHASSTWMTTDDLSTVDRDGNTFKQKANYLLTSKERSRLRKAMLEFDSSRNIVDLFNVLSEILDTPSKKLLWKFILSKLNTTHREFCVNRINHPQNVLLEIVQAGNSEKGPTANQDRSYKNGGVDKERPHLASFHQQVEYLLTSKERSQLKKALQIYAGKRTIENLMEDLEVVLDTPSKQTLWMYIVPLLVAEHQEIIRQKLNIPIFSTANNSAGEPQLTNDSHIYNTDDEFNIVGLAASTLRRSRDNQSSFSSDDEIKGRTLKAGVKRARGRLWKKMHPGYEPVNSKEGRGFDVTLLRELEQTRRVVEEAKRMFQAGHRFDDDMTDSDDDYGFHSTKYVTVIPIGCKDQDATEKPDKKVGKRKILLQTNGQGLKAAPDIILTSDSENETELKIPIDKAKFPLRAGDSFNRRALTALKELDAAMAGEVSDLDINGTAMDILRKAENGGKQMGDSSDVVSLAVPPPPAPPPPPPPPPLPPSSGAIQNTAPQQQPAKMNVKRINWDKLDQSKVGNTIWEQAENVQKDVLGENDLDDVVKYLELEQHFSTMSAKTSRKRPKRRGMNDKRQEIYILNPKKAYNISILLGHVKMTVHQMKQALFLMDEEVLTPELLRQLLAFAPSPDEMEKYDTFDGDLDDLSKPDRFAYEMSRVPGYEQRLKALLFKGNFNERIAEMKENLQNIRKASAEMRHSKKLAKILELILAMGNYMNKGNNRVGGAAGFKIAFLAQLDITKTKDNKTTFIHVLAEAVYNKFPDYVSVGEDLTTVPVASKVSDVMLNQELQELRKVLQDISKTLDKFGSQKTSIGINDRFQDVMGHFISQAQDEIQGLFRLQANTMEEFQNMVQYFGEDSKKTTTEIFGIFSEFITKFERAHRYNMMYKRHHQNPQKVMDS